MPKAHKQWKVLPHGRISEIDDGIFTVVGHITMPLMDLPRRMTVVRLDDGRLVVWSAIALREEEMAKLESHGAPAFLIVPNDHHRLDAKVWKERYPNMQVVAPAGAREKVEQVVPVDTTAPDFGDPHVEFVTVAGTEDREAALIVRTKNGMTLVLNDVVGNIRDSSGIGGWFLRRMRFAGRKAQIPRPVKRLMVKDEQALRGQLLQWAEAPSLKRILVSHGAPIDNPQQSLRSLAQSLH